MTGAIETKKLSSETKSLSINTRRADHLLPLPILLLGCELATTSLGPPQAAHERLYDNWLIALGRCRFESNIRIHRIHPFAWVNEDLFGLSSLYLSAIPLDVDDPTR